MVWKILNKLDITRAIDNALVKSMDLDGQSRRIDFTPQEAWKYFKYAIIHPTWDEFVKYTKITFAVFTLTGLPYLLISVLVKIITGGY